MSAEQTRNSSSSRGETRRSTAGFLASESDDRFFQSLFEFIELEKRFLQSPENGPDELRYIIYRSVFNKVIAQATDYKRLLLTIKAEYDDIIQELKRRNDEVRGAQQTVAASMSCPKSLITCKRRANQLRDRQTVREQLVETKHGANGEGTRDWSGLNWTGLDWTGLDWTWTWIIMLICLSVFLSRISELQRETSRLQEELQRQKSSKDQSTWTPGLTVSESEDPEALDRHLQHLQVQRAALLDRKSHCVSLEVKAELDAKLQTAESHRDQLSSENRRLKVLSRRLWSVCDCLSSWEEGEGEGQVPLEELVGSTLENIRQNRVTDDDAELFEEEQPTGADEAELLTDHLDRFIELFDLAQYEKAALLAATSPGGVLRNLHTMTMFKAVQAPPGSVPPPLLFFQALLMTVPDGVELSASLSVVGVVLALQRGASQLVVHAVTQNKISFTEHLGDILTEHAQNNPGVADLCLALATIIYEACGLDRKTALSMCKRGLICSAAEFMKHRNKLTAEDCLWVLCRSPSLSLLQLLTKHRGRGRAAILSVGGTCSTLLVDHQQWDLAFQLLDGFVSQGQGVLQDVILEDSDSSVEVWILIASLCSELKRADLSQDILSVLLDQGGTRVLSPDLEGAGLMEHVFL